MKSFFKENGLSLILFVLFILCLTGQFVTGLASHNEDLQLHHVQMQTPSQYLTSGHFIESTFENWESEFLQMAVYVLLTAVAYQKGSAESNPLPDEKNAPKLKFPKRYFKNSPVFRKLYENSLSLALLAIFFLSFSAHLYGGWREENLKHLMTHDSQNEVSLWQFLGSAEFWFQSFQNWQSEFLSVAVLVMLTVFFRQKGSAQSKEVDAPHSLTGG